MSFEELSRYIDTAKGRAEEFLHAAEPHTTFTFFRKGPECMSNSHAKAIMTYSNNGIGMPDNRLRGVLLGVFEEAQSNGGVTIQIVNRMNNSQFVQVTKNPPRIYGSAPMTYSANG